MKIKKKKKMKSGERIMLFDFCDELQGINSEPCMAGDLSWRMGFQESLEVVQLGFWLFSIKRSTNSGF